MSNAIFGVVKLGENHKMMKKPENVVAFGSLVLSGSAFGAAILAILISIVGFNSDEYFHDDKLGNEFAAKSDLGHGEIFAWVHSPFPIYIKHFITNLYKIDEDGAKVGIQDIADLVPIDGSSFGGGVLTLEIYDVDEDVMPDLRATNQELAAMVYVDKELLPTSTRYAMLGQAMLFKNWKIVKYSIFGSAIGCILLGIALLYKNIQEKSSMPVIVIAADRGFIK